MNPSSPINVLDGTEVNNFPTIIRTPVNLSDKHMKYHTWYMDNARLAANMSHCVRRLVGAVIVRDGHVISTGWNGMPQNFTNVCELPGNITNPLVRHAERNALERFMSRPDATTGSDMYVTTAPCLDCAITIVTRAKLNQVIFQEFYRSSEGVEYLLDNNVIVFQFDGQQMYQCTN